MDEWLPKISTFYKLLSWAALSLFALYAYSCSEPASPYGQTDITLEALDASCTEVWLDLKFSNLTQPADVAIQKDGKDYLRILSLNRDTLLPQIIVCQIIPKEFQSFLHSNNQLRPIITSFIKLRKKIS